MGRTRLPAGFQRLLAAAISSNLGDGIRVTALPLLAADVTRDPLAIGAVTGITMAPWLLGPIGGAIVDRGDRIRIMQLGQVARGGAVAALGVVALTGTVQLWMVYAVALLIGVGEVLVDSALQASIPALVEGGQLEQANGRMVAGMTISGEVVGGPVGGLLFSLGAGLPFLVDASTFLLAAVLLVGIRLRPRQRTSVAEPVAVTVGSGAGGAGIVDGEPTARQEPPPTRFWADVREGMAALWDHDLLRPLAGVVGLVNVGTAAVGALLVLLALDELGLSEAGYGYLLGVGAVGGLLGSLAADEMRILFGRPAVLMTAGVLVAAGEWLVAFAPSGGVAALGIALVAFAGGTFNVVGRSLRQAVVPDELLGRVIATFRVVGVGGIPVGAFLGGAVATLTSVRATMVLAAALLSVAAVLLTMVTRRIPEEHRR